MNSSTLIIASTLVLSGCLATTDLLTTSSLSTEHRKIAETMAANAQRQCITYSHIQGSPDTKLSGDTKVATKPLIRRFFRSNTSWYKAMTTVNGVTDHIYYDTSSRKFVCGDNLWSKVDLPSQVKFIEVN